MTKRLVMLLLSIIMIFVCDEMDAFASETEEIIIYKTIEETCTGDDVSGSARKEARSIHSHLTGTNLKLFNRLEEMIRETAVGARNVTEYSIDFSDIGVDQTSWTAEELGVDAIISGGRITAEAQQAVADKLGIDFHLVLENLIADCAYELYWYDKTGSTIGPLYSYAATSENISIASKLSFRFPVEEEYAVSSYIVDGDKVKEVDAALKNAEEIIERYSECTDYEKIKGYCEEICEKVTYNQDAASGAVHYGNPWQLVYVFDGDDDTNTVCEGYAKAFQYLCDKTTFDDETVNCISVTGYMSGGTGAGAHMWNIVTMKNGKNYLVDVTNCDEGTIGEGNQLLLQGYLSGNVENGYVYQCDSGNVKYVYDTATRDVFEDSELKLAADAYPYVCSNGKKHTSCVKAGRKATCTKTGLTDGTYCSVCNETLIEQKTIAKISHTWEKTYTVDKQATTSSYGMKSYHCSVCDAKKPGSTVIVPQIKTIKLSYTKTEYNGKTKKPTVTILDSKGNKISSSYYELEYQGGRKDVGSYYVKVKFKGQYSGTKKLTFKINPKATSITKITAGGRKISVNWKKVTSQISGYQIYYSTDKTFSKYKTSEAKTSTISKSISGLEAGKKYYVKMRTYKTVDGTNYYSSWTNIKDITPKPAATSISKVTTGSKKLTVKWNKVSTQVTGYQIEYSTSSSFADAKTKSVKVSGASKVAKTITGLKKGKYYVRIRTYRIVNKQYYYSAWSGSKTATVK